MTELGPRSIALWLFLIPSVLTKNEISEFLHKHSKDHLESIRAILGIETLIFFICRMQAPRANSASRPSSSGQPAYYPNQQYPMQPYNQQPSPYGQPPMNNVNIPPQGYPQNNQPNQYQQQQWQQQGAQQYQQQQGTVPQQDPQWTEYYRKLEEWHRYQQYRRDMVAQQQAQQQSQQQMMMQSQQMIPPGPQQQMTPPPQQQQTMPPPQQQMMPPQHQAMPPPQQQQYQQPPPQQQPVKQQPPPQPKQSMPQLVPPGGPWPGNIQNAVQFYLGEAQRQRQHLQQKQAVAQQPTAKSQPEIQQAQKPLTSQPQLQVPASQPVLPPPPKQVQSNQQIPPPPQQQQFQQPLPQLHQGPTQQSSFPSHQTQQSQSPQLLPFSSQQQSLNLSPQQLYQQQVQQRSQSPSLAKKSSNKNSQLPEQPPSPIPSQNQQPFRSQPQYFDKPSTAPQATFISTATFNANQAGINVSQFDLIKARLKSTRDKIYTLIGREQTEMDLIDKEIQVEKNNGLTNKKKAIYLLKQRKHFQQNIENLQTRMQVLVKTLSTLNQQNLDKEIIDVLEQSNQYMQAVQDELERRGWRDIIEEARYRPEDAFAGMAEESNDPEVDKMYAQLERQVTSQKIKTNTSALGQQKSTSIINQMPASGLKERVIEVPLIPHTNVSQLNHQQSQQMSAPLMVEQPVSSIISPSTSMMNHQPPQVIIQPPSVINTPSQISGAINQTASGLRPPQQATTSSISVSPSQQQTLSQTSSLVRASEIRRQQQHPTQPVSVIYQPQQSQSNIQSQPNMQPTSSIRSEHGNNSPEKVPSNTQINSGVRPSVLKYVSNMQVVVEEEPQFGSVMSKKNSGTDNPMDNPHVQMQFGSGAKVVQISRINGGQVQQQQELGSDQNPNRPPSIALTIKPPSQSSQISIPPPFIPPPPQIPQQILNQFNSGAQLEQNVRTSGVSNMQRSTVPPRPVPMHPSTYNPNGPPTTSARHTSDVVFKK